MCRWLGGPQGRSGQLRKISPPPGFAPRISQRLANSCTDWAIPAHKSYFKISICVLTTHSLCVPENLFKYVEIKCQLDATEVFIADLIACSTCFGHHYAYHQELKSIIQWLLPMVFRAVKTYKKTYKIIFYVFTARNTTGSNHCTILLSSWWWA